MLAHGISLTHLKGIEQYKRTFVCTAITYGYFKVPEFRSIFLKQITNKSRAQLPVDLNDPVYSEPARALRINDLVDSCLKQAN